MGRYGEYLTYNQLKKFEKDGAKFLFNVYIPKDDGGTTEIDVLMICKKGVFVFESKNYSGWIFGSEHQKNWYQTLPKGKKSHKECFYNPILQNRSHIKHLKAFLGKSTPTHSIIIFSDRCTLKSINLTSDYIPVINRKYVMHTVSDICNRIQYSLLDESDVTKIYDMLYPLTQVSAAVRARHIENIKNKNKKSSRTDVTDELLDTNIEQTISEPNSASPEENNESHPIDPVPNEATETAQSSDTSEVTEATEVTETTETTQAASICPRCGGSLILRTARRGANTGKQFYGCSNYPKCRYIQNI